jgi:hypothetical protein
MVAERIESLLVASSINAGEQITSSVPPPPSEYILLHEILNYIKINYPNTSPLPLVYKLYDISRGVSGS